MVKKKSDPSGKRQADGTSLKQTLHLNEPVYVDMKITKILKEKLRDSNLTAVSRATNIPKGQLSEWRQGRLPSLKNLDALVRLSHYLNLTPAQLLGLNVDETIVTALTFDDEGRRYKISITKEDK